jgi:hypothetical protein
MSDPLSSQQKADEFRGYTYKSLQTAGLPARVAVGGFGGAQLGLIILVQPKFAVLVIPDGASHLLRDTQREQP